MLLAKHAKWQGGLHADDGNHALYHVETREVLSALGLNITLSDTFEDLFDKPDVDFVFPLLNRAGFFNSEMLAPLLCTRHGLPYLGASPIIRGLSDDKHLTKLTAAQAGLPTAPWAVFRRNVAVDLARCPDADRYVIKPNASSASWGVRDAADRAGAGEAVAQLHAEGHDAIVEPFLPGNDVEVSLITVGGTPRCLPLMVFEQDDPTHLRTYSEKRALDNTKLGYVLRAYDDDADISARIEDMTRRLWGEYHPFDYGRFEFRVDPETGAVNFIEVNLNCNLSSTKTIATAARLARLDA